MNKWGFGQFLCKYGLNWARLGDPLEDGEMNEMTPSPDTGFEI